MRPLSISFSTAPRLASLTARMLAASLVGLLAAAPALAATATAQAATPASTAVAVTVDPPPATLAPQAMITALARANAAVVGVQVTATDGARSIETLGRNRSGSGVVIDTGGAGSGVVLTIGYLLIEADQIQLRTQSGRRVPATVLGYDIATGFGLVRPLLPLGDDVPSAPLGSIRDLDTGSALTVATGGALGDVDTTQLVSKRAFSGNWEYHIDAALFTAPPVANHSGAPVFNQRGEVVGIGSLFVADALGTGRRLPGNMFVPIDLLRPILPELQRTGSTRRSHRPWLGLNAAEQGGRIQIVRVNAEGPAEAAGVQPGDVLLAIDGDKVESLEGFYKKLWSREAPDAEVRLTLQPEGGAVKTIVLRGVDRTSVMKKPAGI